MCTRVALPARGRSIQGHEAARIISRDLTRATSTALDLTGERAERLLAHVAALEDHRALTQAVRYLRIPSVFIPESHYG